MTATSTSTRGCGNHHHVRSGDGQGRPVDCGRRRIVSPTSGKQPGKWKDARTFVLRVRLKPNHSYWISVNSQRFQNFRNRQGEPASPTPFRSRLERRRRADTPVEKTRTMWPPSTSSSKRSPRSIPSATAWDRLAGIDRVQRGQLDAAPDAKAFARLAATLLRKRKTNTFGSWWRGAVSHLRAARHAERERRALAGTRAGMERTFFGAGQWALGRRHRLCPDRHLGPQQDARTGSCLRHSRATQRRTGIDHRRSPQWRWRRAHRSVGGRLLHRRTGALRQTRHRRRRPTERLQRAARAHGSAQRQTHRLPRQGRGTDRTGDHEQLRSLLC